MEFFHGFFHLNLRVIFLFDNQINLFKAFLLSLTLLVFLSCEPKKKEEEREVYLQKRILKGRIDIPLKEYHILLYRLEKESETLIDTIPISPTGRFYFEYYAVEAEICRLDIFEEESVNFVAAEETVDIQVENVNDETIFTFRRSLENKSFEAFQQLKKQIFIQKQRLTQQGKLSWYDKEIDNSIIQFVEDNQSFYSALLALELLNIEDHQEYLSKQVDRYKEKYEFTEAWKSIHQTLKPYIHLSNNTSAPLFSLPNQYDSIIHLKDLRGKNVLLNFWADWCLQCPETQPYLNEWQQAQFEKRDSVIVIHVSLDTDIKNWKGKIAKTTNFKQINLIAKKSWDSDIVKDYNIKALPMFCLIDSTGKIQSYDFNMDSLFQ